MPTDAEKAGKKRKKRMNDAFDLAEAQPEGSRRVLVTTSGKVVNIPQAWQEELDDHVENKNLGSFWGVLFAGDGQRSKSMRLKNGKWDSLDDWNGVRIKVYDIDADFTLPGSPFPSFIDQVPRFNTFNEAEMLKRHGESRARGGGGVTFLSYPSNTTVGQAGRLVPYDAAGYTTYAQKIVDFLEVVPLHCLQLLENELEMSGIDIFDEDLDDSLLPDFETVVQTVKTSLLPPEVEPKKAKRPGSPRRPTRRSSRRSSPRRQRRRSPRLAPRGGASGPRRTGRPTMTMTTTTTSTGTRWSRPTRSKARADSRFVRRRECSGACARSSRRASRRIRRGRCSERRRSCWPPPLRTWWCHLQCSQSRRRGNAGERRRAGGAACP